MQEVHNRFENEEVFHAIQGVLASIQACFTTPTPSWEEGSWEADLSNLIPANKGVFAYIFLQGFVVQ